MVVGKLSAGFLTVESQVSDLKLSNGGAFQFVAAAV